jgi:diguanylate cyclase (GGDEF)-like protein
LERAAAEARRDPLTGLANRLAWTEALSAASACAESPVRIVQLDCRDPKLINDTHGHHIGDHLLCRVATVLTSSARNNDLVARLGGDEFAILLCGADEETSRTIVRQIQAALAVDREPGQPQIRLAIGTSNTRDEDLETAQQQADAEMPKAKRLPRGVPTREASTLARRLALPQNSGTATRSTRGNVVRAAAADGRAGPSHGGDRRRSPTRTWPAGGETLGA